MKFRLLQARLPEDPVRPEELSAFAAKLGVREDAVQPFDLLSQETSLAIVIDDVDAVLVGGSGAFSINDDHAWLRQFIDTLGALSESGFPTFASCFGFQGLIVSLGGAVERQIGGEEVGSFDLELHPEAASDPLFGSLPRRFVAQEGHKDSATRLPSSVVNYVSSERCAYQAVRVGRMYATQFHPELNADENRQRLARYLKMYSAAFGASKARRMLDDFRESPESCGLLRRFVALLERGEI